MVLRDWFRRSVTNPSRSGDRDDTPSDESAAPANTLGSWLREHRLAAGFELEQAAEETRISHGYLGAIEADRFDVLPAPVYVRGFVRLYARFLGIDPEDAVDRLPDNLPEPPGLDPLPGLRLREGVGALPAVGRRWALLAALAAIVLVATLIFGVPNIGPFGPDDEGGADGSAATASPTAEGTAPPLAEQMPDLSGLAQAAAEQRVRDLGAEWVVIEVPSSEAEPGHVFTQVPAPGEVLQAGQGVTLVVAKEPTSDGE